MKVQRLHQAKNLCQEVQRSVLTYVGVWGKHVLVCVCGCCLRELACSLCSPADCILGERQTEVMLATYSCKWLSQCSPVCCLFWNLLVSFSGGCILVQTPQFVIDGNRLRSLSSTDEYSNFITWWHNATCAYSYSQLLFQTYIQVHVHVITPYHSACRSTRTCTYSLVLCLAVLVSLLSLPCRLSLHTMSWKSQRWPQTPSAFAPSRTEDCELCKLCTITWSTNWIHRIASQVIGFWDSVLKCELHSTPCCWKASLGCKFLDNIL